MTLKKFLPIATFFMALLAFPTLTQAGLSDRCFPSIQCDESSDYYAGSCQKKIDTINDCPVPPFGQFSAFSCDYGCYFRTRPEFQECAGGFMVNGTCMTSLEIVNDENQSKIWDGVELESIGAGGEGLWETDGVHVYRSSGNVGIGVENPEDYPLDVAGPINVNHDVEGAAIYANQRQMLWYNKEFGLAGWGFDADVNLFPKRVGIGAMPPEETNLYVEKDEEVNALGGNYTGYFYNKNSGTTATTGIFTRGEAANASTYGLTSYAWSTGSNDAHGIYSYALVQDNNNADIAYGLYSISMNNSNNCDNEGCAHSYGVYSKANGPLSTGVYGEARQTAGHFVGASNGNSNTVGLKVESEASGSTGATFNCDGPCTSAIFYDGDDVAYNEYKSGMVIIGSPTSNHLSFDNNEIMAKQLGSFSTLHLNADGGSVMLTKGNPAYKLQLANDSNNLKGRGLAFSWDTFSDSRVKMNQRDLKYGLDTLMKLRPKSYDHYSGTVQNGQVMLGEDYEPTIGFIAQEVYDVIPEAVRKPADESNELWTMDSDKLVPVLVNAIQEQQTTIDQLTSAVCDLNPKADICSESNQKAPSI